MTPTSRDSVTPGASSKQQAPLSSSSSSSSSKTAPAVSSALGQFVSMSVCVCVCLCVCHSLAVSLHISVYISVSAPVCLSFLLRLSEVRPLYSTAMLSCFYQTSNLRIYWCNIVWRQIGYETPSWPVCWGLDREKSVC